MLIKKHCFTCKSDFFIGGNQTPAIYAANDIGGLSYFYCPYCEAKISIPDEQITKLQKRT